MPVNRTGLTYGAVGKSLKEISQAITSQARAMTAQAEQQGSREECRADILYERMDISRLMVLKQLELYAKFSKCEFLLILVTFLGHVASNNGVEVDPRKTKVFKNLQKPLTHTNINSFLGLVGYYCRVLDGCSFVAVSLRILTKKKAKFELMEACEKSVQDLKDRLTSALVVTLLKCGENYTVYSEEFHPSYESSLVIEVKEGQHLDPMLMELKDSMLVKMNETFSLGDYDILRFQDRLCVRDVDDLQTKIIVETHGYKYSIHLGFTKMYHDHNQIFWWACMKKDVAYYVAKCPYCQLVKAKHLKSSGLIHIFEVWTFKCEGINMDFVVGLLKTRRQHYSIWVIVNKMTKSAHFIR
ncbi:uncharacterized protein [Solanum lycopersicum]|uniref:uncharacterized protein n=1 Tax=Solanum lycopersicum TaxID=4081 RepID=UPI003747E76E